MTSYKVKKSGSSYNIVEIIDNVHYIVAQSSNKDVAYRLSSHLNLGGGFDGATPTFFITPPVKLINKDAEVC
jgi:hypothetical protein